MSICQCATVGPCYTEAFMGGQRKVMSRRYRDTTGLIFVGLSAHALPGTPVRSPSTIACRCPGSITPGRRQPEGARVPPERENIRALVAHRYGDVGDVWRPLVRLDIRSFRL